MTQLSISNNYTKLTVTLRASVRLSGTRLYSVVPCRISTMDAAKAVTSGVFRMLKHPLPKTKCKK